MYACILLTLREDVRRVFSSSEAPTIRVSLKVFNPTLTFTPQWQLRQLAIGYMVEILNCIQLGTLHNARQAWTCYSNNNRVECIIVRARMRNIISLMFRQTVSESEYVHRVLYIAIAVFTRLNTRSHFRSYSLRLFAQHFCDSSIYPTVYSANRYHYRFTYRSMKLLPNLRME